MSDTDAAWLAGLVDGEGSILLRGPRVQVANNSYPLLLACQRMTGLGTITGDRGCYKWRTNTKAAALAICRDIHRHLIIKKHLALEVLNAS